MKIIRKLFRHRRVRVKAWRVPHHVVNGRHVHYIDYIIHHLEKEA
jgi:hypothetical protein